MDPMQAIAVLVDAAWYARRYPDVPEADALRHFAAHGLSEGRDPNPFFDTAWYAREYPQVAESGLPGFDVSAWNGILAPRGTPRAVVALLNRELNRIAENPDVKNRALAQGTDLETQTPEQFGAFLAAQSAKWIKVAKATGMRAE